MPKRPSQPVPSSAERARGKYEIPEDAAVPARVREPQPPYAEATVVSATEAARRFSDLVNRAGYQGETFVIERGGRAICQLGPVLGQRCTGTDLLALLSRLPRPDDDFLDAVEDLSRRQPPVEKSPWGA